MIAMTRALLPFAKQNTKPHTLDHGIGTTVAPSDASQDGSFCLLRWISQTTGSAP